MLSTAALPPAALSPTALLSERPSPAAARPARTAASAMAASAMALLTLLSACVLGAMAWTTAPAYAEEKVIRITADGLRPKVLTVSDGDTVRFVNDDRSFAYRAVSTSANWSFDSGPVGLLPGRSYTVPDPIAGSGTYTYRVAQDAPFQGSVVVPAPARANASPSPARPGSAPVVGTAPAPTAGAASPGRPTASFDRPSQTARPSRKAGVSAVGTHPQPTPGATALPAPLGTDPSSDSPPTAAEAAADPSPAPLAAAAVPGDLPAASSTRGLGLPAALAAVLAAGVVSLLARVLLAEPLAVRRRGATAGTLDPLG